MQLMLRCPKCGFERQPIHDEFISPDECPKCGVIYEKYMEAVSKNSEKHNERPAVMDENGKWEEIRPGRWQYTKWTRAAITFENVARMVWLAAIDGVMSDSDRTQDYLLSKSWSLSKGKILPALGSDGETIHQDEFESALLNDLAANDELAKKLALETFQRLDAPVNAYMKGEPSAITQRSAEEIKSILENSIPAEVARELDAESTGRNLHKYLIREFAKEVLKGFNRRYFLVYLPLAAIAGILFSILKRVFGW